MAQHPEHEDVYLTRRKGFVKLAIQGGAGKYKTYFCCTMSTSSSCVHQRLRHLMLPHTQHVHNPSRTFRLSSVGTQKVVWFAVARPACCMPRLLAVANAQWHALLTVFLACGCSMHAERSGDIRFREVDHMCVTVS